MAVNSITFGNIDSADYGIYISGEGVFDAPKRVVEMVSIPGRNGALAVDQGYYDNITVTYPGHNYEPDMDDFKENLSAFRNALASQIGYQRLSDTFHPDEYRMAVFHDGIDINPIKYNTAAQFDIKFDCKPQRYLTSGETEVTVSDGGTITNPTDYASSPLLAIKGPGNLLINDEYDINLSDALIGRIELSSETNFTGVIKRATFNENIRFMNDNDVITSTTVLKARIKPQAGSGFTAISISSVADSNPNDFYTMVHPSNAFAIIESRAGYSYLKSATAQATNTITISGTVSGGGSSQSFTATINITMDYNSDSVRAFWSASTPGSSGLYVSVSLTSEVSTIYPTIGESTMSVLGDPTYIDCDLGECYQVIDGVPVSLNKYIALGSDLPELQPGTNTITYDSTITEVKVTPRWWKL